LFKRHALPVATVKVVALLPRPEPQAPRYEWEKARAPAPRAGAFEHHDIHGVIAGIAGSAANQISSPARQSGLFSPSLAFTAI